MKKTRYLIKKDNYYYYKRKIPKCRKNITISLNTDSLLIAKYIIDMLNSKTTKLFLMYLGNMNKQIEEKNEVIEYVRTLLKKYVSEAIIEYGELEELRHNDFTYTNEDNISLDGGHPFSIEKAKKEIELGIHNEDIRENLYNRIIKRTNITDNEINHIAKSQQKILKYKLLKAENEILMYDNARNNNILQVPNLLKEEFREFTDINSSISYDEKQQKFQKALKSKQEQTTSHNEIYYKKTLLELKNEYIEIKNKEGLKDLKRYETDIQMLIDITKKDYAINISQQDMKEFVNILEYLPNKNEFGDLYKKHTYKEIFDLYEKTPWEKNSISTVNNRIIRISAFLNWCVEDEYLDKNRLANKKTKIISKKKAKKWERQSYTNEDLDRLFKSSWYTKNLVLNLKEHPDKIFAPLLGLYQGFRVNELCSLYIKDIITVKNISCINIEEDEPDKHIKGDATERIVPIHPKLIELGFLDYVAYQKKQGQKRIFPNLYYIKGKGYGQPFSKKFNNKNFKREFIEEEFLQTGAKKRKDFHSFRHTFTENLKDVEGVQDGALDYLNGHFSSSHSQKTYGKRNMERLYQIISKLEYEFNITEIKNTIKKYLEN